MRSAQQTMYFDLIGSVKKVWNKNTKTLNIFLTPFYSELSSPANVLHCLEGVPQKLPITGLGRGLEKSWVIFEKKMYHCTQRTQTGRQTG